MGAGAEILSFPEAETPPLLRVQVERLLRRSPDPVGPFLEAPCYARPADPPRAPEQPAD